MSQWKNNDGEGSKPNWLTEEQKRQCFRTIRGWEIPLAGMAVTNGAETIFGLSAGQTGHYLFRSGSYVGPTELLVSMPYHSGSTGEQAGGPVGETRGRTSQYGATNGGDFPNYIPYFTAPVTGQTYAVTRGVTAFIPLIAADANLTDLCKRFLFSITSGAGVGRACTGSSQTLVNGYTHGTFSTGAIPAGASATVWMAQPTNVVGSVADNYFYAPLSRSVSGNPHGGWGGITQGSAVFVIGITAGGVTGSFPFEVRVWDGRAAGGATGFARFNITVT